MVQKFHSYTVSLKDKKIDLSSTNKFLKNFHSRIFKILARQKKKMMK